MSQKRKLEDVWIRGPDVKDNEKAREFFEEATVSMSNEDWDFFKKYKQMYLKFFKEG